MVIPTIPLHGNSLLPIFKGQERSEPDYFISGMEKFRMFRKGKYKIARINDGDWELYDMQNDPTELDNLAERMPEKVKELAEKYESIQTEHNHYSDR